MRIFALALVVLAPSVALAGPISAGVAIGATQAKAESSADPNHTLGLYGRLGFFDRISGQLELQRIQTDDTNIDIRTGTASLVIDLGSDRHFVPTLAAGIGLDRASQQYGGATTGHHIEGGLGIEYRSDGGFVLGLEGRLGGRTIDSDNMVYPLEGDVLYYAPSYLREGEYRSLRATLGVRF